MKRSIKIINPIIEYGEENRCAQGHGSFETASVSKNWQCPVCNEKLSIRVEIENRTYTVHRMTPQELKQYDLITLENIHIHEILNVAKNTEPQNTYRIALKQYGVLDLSENSILSKIMGKWVE